MFCHSDKKLKVVCVAYDILQCKISSTRNWMMDRESTTSYTWNISFAFITFPLTQNKRYIFIKTTIAYQFVHVCKTMQDSLPTLFWFLLIISFLYILGISLLKTQKMSSGFRIFFMCFKFRDLFRIKPLYW